MGKYRPTIGLGTVRTSTTTGENIRMLGGAVPGFFITNTHATAFLAVKANARIAGATGVIRRATEVIAAAAGVTASIDAGTGVLTQTGGSVDFRDLILPGDTIVWTPASTAAEYGVASILSATTLQLEVGGARASGPIAVYREYPGELKDNKFRWQTASDFLTTAIYLPAGQTIYFDASSVDGGNMIYGIAVRQGTGAATYTGGQFII